MCLSGIWGSLSQSTIIRCEVFFTLPAVLTRRAALRVSSRRGGSPPRAPRERTGWATEVWCRGARGGGNTETTRRPRNPPRIPQNGERGSFIARAAPAHGPQSPTHPAPARPCCLPLHPTRTPRSRARARGRGADASARACAAMLCADRRHRRAHHIRAYPSPPPLRSQSAPAIALPALARRSAGPTPNPRHPLRSPGPPHHPRQSPPRATPNTARPPRRRPLSEFWLRI